VHGAHFDAVHGFAANTAIVDDVSQFSPPKFLEAKTSLILSLCVAMPPVNWIRPRVDVQVEQIAGFSVPLLASGHCSMSVMIQTLKNCTLSRRSSRNRVALNDGGPFAELAGLHLQNLDNGFRDNFP